MKSLASESEPVTITGNDWSAMVPDSTHVWEPSELVSICIPTRDPGQGLTNTLTALAAQSYPHHLLEVVIADDGSSHTVRVPDDLPFSVMVVPLERTLKFGAGRARNAAAAAASGTILMFLDSDVIPERQVVHAYARWFETRRDPFVMGLCRFVDIDDVTPQQLVDRIATGTMAARYEGRHVDDQNWRERTFDRTDDLRVEALDAFRITIGATLAISKSQFEEIGGFAELGIRGVEDTEFGYRAHANGGVFVLDRDATHWHQGRRNLSTSRRAEINRVRAPFVQSLMPIRGFRSGRPPEPSPVDVVPLIRAHVSASNDPTLATRTVQSIEESNGGRSGDIVVSSSTAGSTFDPAFAQAALPAGVRWDDSVAANVQDIFARHPYGVIRAIDDRWGEATISRTRALRRARREFPDDDLIDVAGELFGVWWTTMETLGFAVRDDTGPDGSQGTTPLTRIAGELRQTTRRVCASAFERLKRRAT